MEARKQHIESQAFSHETNLLVSIRAKHPLLLCCRRCYHCAGDTTVRLRRQLSHPGGRRTDALTLAAAERIAQPNANAESGTVALTHANLDSCKPAAGAARA
jgi:hypothetical protein